MDRPLPSCHLDLGEAIISLREFQVITSTVKKMQIIMKLIILLSVSVLITFLIINCFVKLFDNRKKENARR